MESEFILTYALTPMPSGMKKELYKS